MAASSSELENKKAQDKTKRSVIGVDILIDIDGAVLTTNFRNRHHEHYAKPVESKRALLKAIVDELIAYANLHLEALVVVHIGCGSARQSADLDLYNILDHLQRKYVSASAFVVIHDIYVELKASLQNEAVENIEIKHSPFLMPDIFNNLSIGDTHEALFSELKTVHDAIIQYAKKKPKIKGAMRNFLKLFSFDETQKINNFNYIKNLIKHYRNSAYRTYPDYSKLSILLSQIYYRYAKLQQEHSGKKVKLYVSHYDDRGSILSNLKNTLMANPNLLPVGVCVNLRLTGNVGWKQIEDAQLEMLSLGDNIVTFMAGVRENTSLDAVISSPEILLDEDISNRVPVEPFAKVGVVVGKGVLPANYPAMIKALVRRAHVRKMAPLLSELCCLLASSIDKLGGIPKTMDTQERYSVSQTLQKFLIQRLSKADSPYIRDMIHSLLSRARKFSRVDCAVDLTRMDIQEITGTYQQDNKTSAPSSDFFAASTAASSSSSASAYRVEENDDHQLMIHLDDSYALTFGNIIELGDKKNKTVTPEAPKLRARSATI